MVPKLLDGPTDHGPTALYLCANLQDSDKVWTMGSKNMLLLLWSISGIPFCVSLSMISYRLLCSLAQAPAWLRPKCSFDAALRTACACTKARTSRIKVPPGRSNEGRRENEEAFTFSLGLGYPTRVRSSRGKTTRDGDNPDTAAVLRQVCCRHGAQARHSLHISNLAPVYTR